MSEQEAARGVAAVRGAWGAVLVLAPAPVARVMHAGPSWQARAVLRVLGGRHVAQGLVTAADPSRTVVRLGVAVDCAHAASAFAWAASARDRRRAGLASGLAATTFAVAGLLSSRAVPEVLQSPAS